MKTLTSSELKFLIDQQSDLCLSIYFPTERSGIETLQNPMRLKKLRRAALEDLERNGLKKRAADALLEPIEPLMDDYPFWQHQDLGLALFVSNGFHRAYKLPYPVEELALIANRFHLKPMLPLLADGGPFFILALSRNAVELYRANRYAIEKVPLENVPQSEAEALGPEQQEKTLQLHSAGPGSTGQQTAIFHGHGLIKEVAKDRTLRFFRRVDAGLRPYLRDAHSPLVLAGVEYYLPLYQEANTYPHLVPDIVMGNPESLPASDLHRAAWSKVEPLFNQARERAAAAIQANLLNGQATDDLEQATAAACHGRAANCFVALNEHRWGAFDEKSAKARSLDRTDRRACDLLDLAAVQTLLHGGEVFPAKSSEQVPGKGPLAVLLRF